MNENAANEINIRLQKIFYDRLGVDFNDVDETALNEELLGWKIRLKPRDLLYIFFDIEKEFNIVIPEEDIAEGRFNTFNNIAGIISSQVLWKTS